MRVEFGEPVKFARMLAKIALGFAVAVMGLEAFEEIFVRPAILGERDEVGMWVGCPDVPRLDAQKGLHDAAVFVRSDRLVIVGVRLFEEFSAPEYSVIVGRASEAWNGRRPSTKWSGL